MAASPPRNRTRMLAATAGLLCALFAAVPAAQEDATDASAADLERVRSRIQALQAKLGQDRGQQDELRAQLDETQRRIGDISVQVREIARQVKEQTAQVAQLQVERAREDRALAAQRRTLARQVRAAYMIGQRGKTKLVLNQNDTRRLTRVTTYYDYLNRQRSRRIQGILAQIEALTNSEQELRTENDRLQGLRARQQGILQALEAGRIERAQTLKRLETRIRSQASQLDQLLANEREIQGLMQSLQTALADIPLDLGKTRPFSRLKGTLPWPVRGSLLAGFGAPKVGGFRWNGMWIKAADGEPIKAVARGRVAYVGWMHRYGLIVVVEHDGGYYTLYGHNQAVNTTVGEWIDGGDVLASAGTTGGHSQSGLYFEIRKGTDPINPKEWLQR